MGDSDDNNGDAAAFCGFLILIVVVISVILLVKRKNRRLKAKGRNYIPAASTPQNYLHPPSDEIMPSITPPPSGTGLSGDSPDISHPPETDVHLGTYLFNCPDCGTAIYIDPTVKKVKCPKCGHTFRVKKD